MLTDILSRVLELSAESRPVISIDVPLTSGELRWMERNWSAARFGTQQESIAYGSPDTPIYGYGSLLNYTICKKGSELPNHFDLWFEHTLFPELSVRELILLTSVSEKPVPYENLLGEPYKPQEFHIWKKRMLGQVQGRRGILSTLRPCVASVQMIRPRGRAHLARVDISQIVKAGR